MFNFLSKKLSTAEVDKTLSKEVLQSEVLKGDDKLIPAKDNDMCAKEEKDGISAVVGSVEKEKNPMISNLSEAPVCSAAPTVLSPPTVARPPVKTSPPGKPGPKKSVKSAEAQSATDKELGEDSANRGISQKASEDTKESKAMEGLKEGVKDGAKEVAKDNVKERAKEVVRGTTQVSKNGSDKNTHESPKEVAKNSSDEEQLAAGLATGVPHQARKSVGSERLHAKKNSKEKTFFPKTKKPEEACPKENFPQEDYATKQTKAVYPPTKPVAGPLDPQQELIRTKKELNRALNLCAQYGKMLKNVHRLAARRRDDPTCTAILKAVEGYYTIDKNSPPNQSSNAVGYRYSYGEEPLIAHPPPKKGGALKQTYQKRADSETVPKEKPKRTKKDKQQAKEETQAGQIRDMLREATTPEALKAAIAKAEEAKMDFEVELARRKLAKLAMQPN